MFAELTLRFIFGFMLEAQDFLSVCLDLYVFYVCVCFFGGGYWDKARSCSVLPTPTTPPTPILASSSPSLPGGGDVPRILG